MSKTIPNFFIIGTPKGGTTSLYSYMKQHPDIFMSEIKEPRYFTYDESNPEHVNSRAGKFPIRSMDDYLHLFNDVKDEKVAGEASPGYLTSPLACARIREFSPAAKLVASLRNPVDRAYSSYLMHVRAGKETRKVEDAMKPGEQCVEMGLYYENLSRYIQTFGRDKVKVVLFDDLKKDAVSVVKDLYEFLEVDPDFTPDISMRHNSGGIVSSRTVRIIMRTLKINRTLTVKLRSLFPSIHTLWLRIRSANLEAAPQLTKEIRGSLLEYYSEDIGKLESLLEVDLSQWRQ